MIDFTILSRLTLYPLPGVVLVRPLTEEEYSEIKDDPGQVIKLPGATMSPSERWGRVYALAPELDQTLRGSLVCYRDIGALEVFSGALVSLSMDDLVGVIS